jgi:hypothetical protein
LILAKDLLKAAADPVSIFAHKNSYQIKEKFHVRSLNCLDLKSNLALGFCAILNLSHEVFERPFLAYYLKSD